jgi:hypothetical protein
MTWLERITWLALGAALAAPVYPISQFVTQTALGHSPLNPKEH